MRTPHRPTPQLALREISKRYVDNVVLDRVSFTVRPGEKAGLIGENGSGKSTLLRLLAGAETPDNGELTVTADSVAYLPQTLDLPPDSTVREVIDAALADVRELESALRAAEHRLAAGGQEELVAYGELQARFEARGGYHADRRVDLALHGLGLPWLDRDRRIGTLSGGEQARLRLAATLAAEPELLLLDEPTNDLDDEAVAWLENHLRTRHGTVVVVTHDRLFLERTTSAILEVDGDTHRVGRYGDGYQGYLRAKAAQRARWEQEYADWVAETARQQRVAERSGAHLATISRVVAMSNGGVGFARSRDTATGTAHKVRNANEMLRRLRENPVPRPPDPLRFTAQIASATADDTVARLSGIRVGDRLVLDELRVEPGQRLLVAGPNGAGKTTLMRVLAGELRPDHGTIEVRGKVGHLRQQEPAWHPEHSTLQAFAAGRTGLPEEYADELLALGLFRPETLAIPVRSLSTGQQRRLALARLVSAETDLLLLDEPTNHLSPLLVGELQQALAHYQGAVVMVTHDRLLRREFTGHRLELRAGRVAAPQTA